MNNMKAEEYIDRNLSSKTRTVKKNKMTIIQKKNHHIRTKSGNTLNYWRKKAILARVTSSNLAVGSINQK